MARMDYEANRVVTSVIVLMALIGCLAGSAIALGVLAVSTAEYIATMICETWAEREK